MPRTKRKRASIRTEPPDPIPIPLVGLDHFSSLSEEKQRQYIQKSKFICIDNYLQAIEVVKKWKNLPTDEKLRRLLIPLFLYNKLQPFGLDPFDDPIPFVEESVDIERELDLEKLRYDEQRYQIYDEKGNEIDMSGGKAPVTSSSYIFVREKYDGDLENWRKMEAEGGDGFSSIFHLGKIELRDLHEEWLPSLNYEKITSKDLLNQVLVAYTIKKAQNGDKKAIKTLYGLYRGRTEELAIQFACNFKVCLFGKGRVQRAQWQKGVDDLIAEAQQFLRFVITGFSLKDILNQFGILDPLTVIPDTERVIKNIPPWVKHFYIYYLAEYIPQRMENNIRETQRNQELITELGKLPGDAERNQAEVIPFLQARNRFLAFLWIGMLNPYAAFQANTRWKPHKRINRFNSYSFRLGLKKMGPRWNLTTWLFGHKNEIDALTPGKREDGTHGKAWQPYGKILQFLMDKYYKPFKSKRNEEKDLDFNDDFDEDHQENLGFKDRSGVLKDPNDNPEEKREKAENKVEIIAEIKKGVRSLGIPDRNLDRNIEKIYLPWKVEGLTQKKIAQDRGLSERQIGNICREIDRVIPRLRKLSQKFPIEQ